MRDNIDNIFNILALVQDIKISDVKISMSNQSANFEYKQIYGSMSYSGSFLTIDCYVTGNDAIRSWRLSDLETNKSLIDEVTYYLDLVQSRYYH